jgi:transcriptional regulator with XRE-family HTH domain
MERLKSQFSPDYRILLYTLVSLRKKMGRTQVDVAKAMGYPQTVISKCERGRRRIDPVELRRYCIAIGIDFPRFALIYEDNLASGISGARIKKKRTY